MKQQATKHHLQPVDPPVNNVPGPTDEAKGDPGFLLQAARRLELAGGGDEDESDEGDEPDEDDDEDAPESPPAPEPGA
jgi:hypothetical protein